ncbi:MAG: gamma-glutamyltransferase family protein [Planctomycetota bacterium]|jgi:gamma-glutamyltranspeptidase/glutathione hydrolase
MVAAAHPDATAAGVEILAEGGNAVDAAVAAAFALGVCEPQASGLGGQTMMILYTADTRRTVALDGSSRAPNRATAELFDRRKLRRIGYTSTTVPSTPAVLGYAAQKYGRLPIPRLIEPAIRLAEDGYEITELQHSLQKREIPQWREGNAAKLFLKEGREPYPAGALFRQHTIAETLKRLARNGVEDFYRGEIASRIEKDMSDHEGLIQRDDLARIPWPIERRPVTCRYQGLRLHTFPPPGAGRTLVEMLNILSHFPEKRWRLDTPGGASLLAEVIRRAQLDRRDRPYDPNFYPQVEERHMTSAEYAKRVAKQVRSRLKVRRVGAPLGPTEGRAETTDEGRGETTHLSVMDSEGNVVGLTQSIEKFYGAFVATEDLGFLYNNYMLDFEFEDYTHPYYLRPNGVPWASVAPTIVFKGRKPWLVLGSPGSERITSAILQVFLRISKVSPFLAVTAPRMHCFASGKVSLESAWMREDIPKTLKTRGFRITGYEPLSLFFGAVQLVLREGETFLGVADPRRDGSAKGPE